MVTLDFSEPWSLVIESGSEVAACAARELIDCLRRITGRTMPLVTGAGPRAPVFRLVHAESPEDGFTWVADTTEVRLEGQNGRGLLYAVYDLLEAMGCRWISPGRSGERFPAGTSFLVPVSSGKQSPALKGRCLAIGHTAFLREAEDWILWAARNRLNTLFIHVVPGKLPIGAAPIPQWAQLRERCLPLLQERDTIVEYGGHLMSPLVPRDLFKTHPEAFRMSRGKRTRDYNFCPRSEIGIAILRENARKLFEAHSYVDLFHVWPDDIWGGGWCSCERCREIPPSDQALIATNALAEVLTDLNPKARISFLAYYDTQSAPREVEPRSNVSLLWAPRNRCYAHAADDPECGLNVPRYEQGFREQVDFFAKGSQPQVYEYYVDEILFKSVLPPLITVMQRDIAFYRKAGAQSISNLLCGDRPFLTPKPNAWLFARFCWNVEADADSLLEEFCRYTFGTDSPHLPAYYRTLERAFSLALEQPSEDALPTKPLALREILDHPPFDVGDPWLVSPESKREKARKAGAVLDLCGEAEKLLSWVDDASNVDALESEERYFQLVAAWLRFDVARVRLYAAVAPGGEIERGAAHLAECDKALEEICAWGERNLDDPVFRSNFMLWRLFFWKLRIDKIRADHYCSPLERPLLKAKNLARLLRHRTRLERAYRRMGS